MAHADGAPDSRPQFERSWKKREGLCLIGFARQRPGAYSGTKRLILEPTHHE
ncbi:hypothetical protein [Ramlibacter tataouinensis]|uniref:hypothetical protein n=1 Tax=Ramlibacter tataouinensis TaxID=94132 RepID=UPI0013147CE1|nr:hypothetical protein [Ramlibacter tataouinensis]